MEEIPEVPRSERRDSPIKGEDHSTERPHRDLREGRQAEQLDRERDEARIKQISTAIGFDKRPVVDKLLPPESSPEMRTVGGKLGSAFDSFFRLPDSVQESIRLHDLRMTPVLPATDKPKLAVTAQTVHLLRRFLGVTDAELPATRVSVQSMRGLLGMSEDKLARIPDNDLPEYVIDDVQLVANGLLVFVRRIEQDLESLRNPGPHEPTPGVWTKPLSNEPKPPQSMDGERQTIPTSWLK